MFHLEAVMWQMAACLMAPNEREPVSFQDFLSPALPALADVGTQACTLIPSDRTPQAEHLQSRVKGGGACVRGTDSFMQIWSPESRATGISLLTHGT